MNKEKRNILIGAGIILLIILLIYFSSPTIMSATTVNDSILGAVTTKLTTCSWFCQIFHPVEQVAFMAGTYYVGDNVMFDENIIVSKANCLTRGNIVYIQDVIYKDGAVYSTYDVYKIDLGKALLTPCPTSDSTIEKRTWFSPNSAGLYTIKTKVLRAKDTSPTYIDCGAASGGTCSLNIKARITPPNGERYCSGGTLYTWNGASYSQLACGSGSICSGNACVLVTTIPPYNPIPITSPPTPITSPPTPTPITSPPIIPDTTPITVAPIITPGVITPTTPSNLPLSPSTTPTYSTTTQIIFWVMIVLIVILVAFIIYRLGGRSNVRRKR